MNGNFSSGNGVRAAASIVAGAALSISFALAGGCQGQNDNKELFPDMVAPTTLQADERGWPAPTVINLEDGDNEDPGAGFGSPIGGNDWYAQPGYLPG